MPARFFHAIPIPRANKLRERVGISVGADFDQPIFATVRPKPTSIMRRWVVVDPPEVRFRVYRFAFVGGPRRGLDQIENCPPRLIEHCTSAAKRAPNAILPAESSATCQPEAPKPKGRPFEKFQAARRKVECVEYSWMSTPKQHAINVQEQDRSNVRPKTGLRHPNSAIFGHRLKLFRSERL
jgi:hypothetical protein